MINHGLLQHIVQVLLESESSGKLSVVVGGIAGLVQSNRSLGSGPPREVIEISLTKTLQNI